MLALVVANILPGIFSFQKDVAMSHTHRHKIYVHVGLEIILILHKCTLRLQ